MRTGVLLARPLRAFTLLELIIAMFLGVIIVTVVYGVYGNIQSEWRQFYRKQNDILSLLLLKQAMDKDMENAICICRDKQTNRYLFITDNDTVCYDFQTSVVREFGSFRDSFQVSVENIRSFTVPYLEKHRVIDLLVFDIVQPLSISKATFRKRYSAGELITIYQQAVYEP